MAVTANVTLPLLFTGVEWKRPASKALQQAASDAAGGYTQAFVQVDPVEPEYGATAADFLNQDVQYSGDGVSHVMILSTAAQATPMLIISR